MRPAELFVYWTLCALMGVTVVSALAEVAGQAFSVLNLGF